MRRRTTAAAGVLLTAALSIGFSGTAQAAPDRDCKDFASQAEAQAALLPGDPERLDANHNGVACENYDYGTAGAAPRTTSATGSGQVSTRPTGAVAAGDGSSSSDEGSAVPYILGGVALAGAGGAAFAARRSSRATA